MTAPNQTQQQVKQQVKQEDQLNQSNHWLNGESWIQDPMDPLKRHMMEFFANGVENAGVAKAYGLWVLELI